MIRVLARLVASQISAPQERSREEPDPLPQLYPNVKQGSSISRAGVRTNVPLPGTQVAEASGASGWLEPSDYALVVLFTELAQRRVQAAQTQEETHEYGSYHHNPSRTHGVCLRAPIDPVASQ